MFINEILIFIMNILGILVIFFYNFFDHFLMYAVADSWKKKEKEEAGGITTRIRLFGLKRLFEIVAYVPKGIFGSILDQQATGIDLVAGNEYLNNLTFYIITNPNILLDFLLQK